jgi:hypothetical protein
MFKIYNINADASIRSDIPIKNAGFNNQLTLFNTYFSDLTLTLKEFPIESRIVMRFDAEDILSAYELDNNYDITLVMNYTTYKVENENAIISAYPLTNSFMEGFGYNSDRIEGVTWNNRTTNTPWQTQGSDYDSTFKIADSSIDVINRQIKFDMSDFLSYIQTESNNGIVLLNGQQDIIRASFYSRHSPTYGGSYIIMFKNTYQVNAGTAKLFRNGSIQYDDFIIRPLPYQSNIKKGNIFICYLTVEDAYRRTSFTYSNDVFYLPNMKYRIYDYTRSREFVFPSDNNKIPVNNGLYIRFSTDNFPVGKYYIEPIYDDGIVKKVGEPIFFNVTDEQYYHNI